MESSTSLLLCPLFFEKGVVFMAQPQKDVKNCTFTIERSVLMMLEECARITGVPKSNLVDRALRNYFVGGPGLCDNHELCGFVSQCKQQLQ